MHLNKLSICFSQILVSKVKCWSQSKSKCLIKDPKLFKEKLGPPSIKYSKVLGSLIQVLIDAVIDTFRWLHSADLGLVGDITGLTKQQERWSNWKKATKHRVYRDEWYIFICSIIWYHLLSKKIHGNTENAQRTKSSIEKYGKFDHYPLIMWSLSINLSFSIFHYPKFLRYLNKITFLGQNTSGTDSSEVAG